MADKRKSPPTSNGSSSFSGGPSSSLVKRQKQASVADEDGTMQVAISSSSNGTNSKGLIRSVKRTSSLAAPILALTGAHSGEILDVKFSPDGQLIAAASADKTISLWQTFGENSNIGVLKSHSKAVTSIAWSPSAPRSSPRLFSASADGTLIVWNATTGSKERRLRGHKGIINCVSCTRGGREVLVSGGDDGKVMLWDPQERDALDVLNVGYPVTAVCFSDDGSQVYVGGLDNDVHVYDLLRKEIVFSLRGHTNTITSLSLSPSGTYLLSTSMDDSVRIWDVQPFAPEPAPGQTGNVRLHRTLSGAVSGFENLLIKASWSHDGRKVATGGGDRTCTIWDAEEGSILYKLPGHTGSCVAVALHPKEPIIISCSTDKTMLLGEIEP